jgi:hypothetical protein
MEEIFDEILLKAMADSGKPPAGSYLEKRTEEDVWYCKNCSWNLSSLVLKDTHPYLQEEVIGMAFDQINGTTNYFCGQSKLCPYVRAYANLRINEASKNK